MINKEQIFKHTIREKRLRDWSKVISSFSKKVDLSNLNKIKENLEIYRLLLDKRLSVKREQDIEDTKRRILDLEREIELDFENLKFIEFR